MARSQSKSKGEQIMASSKGSDYERETCRKLSVWWSEEDRDDLFWRSAGSGAMAKTRSKIGKSTFGQYGDIQAVDPKGQLLLDTFTMELKRGYNSDNFMNMMDKKETAAKQMWEKFFDQVHEDSINADSKTWMIIWRRDRKEALIYTPIKIIKQLSKAGSRLQDVPHMRGKVRLKEGKLMSIFFCALDDFLNVVDPEHIKTLWEKLGWNKAKK